MDLATKRTKQLATVPRGLVVGPRGLAVSPDGRSILYTHEDLTLGDIMLIEDFQ
jgi:DNA-binding beta-propeller fold protein YncE